MTNAEQALIDNLDKLKAAIAQADELYGKKIERLELRVQELTAIVNETIELVDNSDGVSGLHLNGDIATWRELMENGWLGCLADELDKNTI